MKNAIDVFPISEDEALDIDELRDTFKDKSDLRAVLEDYFHIYDDFAEMSVDVFNTYFKEYTEDSIESSADKEIKSSPIGDIHDDFAIGKIKEDEAIKQLTKTGKGKRDAKKLLERWKENDMIKSSVDSVVKDIEDYFGTEAGEDNVIECDDIITHKDVTEINELIEDDEDVKVKIGTYSVTVDEAPEITNAVDLSVEEDEDNVTVSIEKPEDEDNVIEDESESEEDNSNKTSFVQINSEEDYDNYNVHLPEDYEFEDVRGMWWEIDGDEGLSMRDVIQQNGDKESFIIIDNDRIFFDTAYNYILDSDCEVEDYGFEESDFEEGKFIGD